MKLVTRYEASRLSLDELHSLLRQAFNTLSAAPRGSQQRRDALASLETIERELACRCPGF